MRFPRLGLDGPETALAAWGAVQTVAFLSEHDSYSVVFSPDIVMLPWVVILWAKNLAAGAVVAGLLVALLRLTVRLGPSPDAMLPARGRTGFWMAVALLAASGVAARWLLPSDVPPGLWCDVAYESEDAMRSPAGGPLWGGIPLALDGRPNSAMVSNLYLAGCRLVLAVFGQGEAGLRAVSALPGAAVPFAGFAAATIAWGWRRGLAALALLSLAAWPVIFSLWTWSGSALVALSAASLAAALASSRRRSTPLAAVSGGLTGLSLHTHPAAWAVAFGMVLFGGWEARTAARRRQVAAAVAAALLCVLPFLAAFASHPSRLGGRTADVSVASPSRVADVPRSLPLRLLDNAVRYTGFFLFTIDPNPRHNIPAHRTVTPLLGFAIAIGAARAAREASRGSAGDLLLLLVALSALLAGLLSNPAGSPNTFRLCGTLVPLLLLATGPLVAWGTELARILRARGPLVGALGAALLLALETGPVLGVWAPHPEVVRVFSPAETVLGRVRRALPAGPTILDPGALRDPIVFEACAAPPWPVEPLARLPRLAPEALRAAPPAAGFWYVATPEALDALRAAGFSARNGAPADTRGTVARLSWVRPPSVAATVPPPE